MNFSLSYDMARHRNFAKKQFLPVGPNGYGALHKFLHTIVKNCIKHRQNGLDVWRRCYYVQSMENSNRRINF